jgi:hypothetical protein
MNPGGLSIAKKSGKSKLKLHRNNFRKAVDSNLTAALLSISYTVGLFFITKDIKGFTEERKENIIGVS